MFTGREVLAAGEVGKLEGREPIDFSRRPLSIFPEMP